MDPITIIEGEDLDLLLRSLELGAADVFRVRIHQTSDGRAVVKVNERMWSPPLGELDA